MRVLITGGGGYLGTSLIRRILATQFESYVKITVLDRFDRGAEALCATLRPGDWERVIIVKGDVRDPRTVEPLARQADVIVHLAGIVGYPACDADPQDADTTNVLGTRIIVAQHRPVIFASTGSCYGVVDGEAREDTPISPLTRYGRNKAEGEHYVLYASVPGTVLRFATLFGPSPAMRWDLLPNDFCRRARLGPLNVYEPKARRTFLHVADAASAIHHILHHQEAYQGTWNIGHPSMNLTKEEVAHLIHRATDCGIVPESGTDPDKRDYAVNYDKWLTTSGFQPDYTLEGTIPQLLAMAALR